jgi:hypothetical protein
LQPDHLQRLLGQRSSGYKREKRHREEKKRRRTGQLQDLTDPTQPA